MESIKAEGVIESKEETVTKKGKPYLKFTIGGKVYNDFELAGKDCRVNDKVVFYYQENTVGDRVYKNIASIGLPDTYAEKSAEELSQTQKEVDSSYANGAREGMFWNNAIQLCISEQKTSIADIQAWYRRIKKAFDERNNG